MEEKDAVIVGARCAGSTLAIGLAERGWDVLLVDRDTFPSETISTHGVYPNTLARFEQLGVMDTLRASIRVAAARKPIGRPGTRGGRPVLAHRRLRPHGCDPAIGARQGHRRHRLGGRRRHTLRRASRRPDRLGDRGGPGRWCGDGERRPGEGQVGLRCRWAGLNGRADARHREGARSAGRGRVPVRLLARHPRRRLRHVGDPRTRVREPHRR